METDQTTQSLSQTELETELPILAAQREQSDHHTLEVSEDIHVDEGESEISGNSVRERRGRGRGRGCRRGRGRGRRRGRGRGQGRRGSMRDSRGSVRNTIPANSGNRNIKFLSGDKI